jgi:hypothetical protein
MIFVIRFVWYELVSFEIRLRTSKGITLVVLPILFSCQGTGVRKRAARLPLPYVRVKRNISCREKRLRLTRMLFLLLEKNCVVG